MRTSLFVFAILNLNSVLISHTFAMFMCTINYRICSYHTFTHFLSKQKCIHVTENFFLIRNSTWLMLSNFYFHLKYMYILSYPYKYYKSYTWILPIIDNNSYHSFYEQCFTSILSSILIIHLFPKRIPVYGIVFMCMLGSITENTILSQWAKYYPLTTNYDQKYNCNHKSAQYELVEN